MIRLRWTEVDTKWWAAVGLVSYEARVAGDGSVMTRSSLDMRWFCFIGTLEEAKQAAQDDYRGRILNELDLDVDALAKEAADAVGDSNMRLVVMTKHIEIAQSELAENPSYDKAIKIQQLTRDRKAAINETRDAWRVVK